MTDKKEAQPEALRLAAWLNEGAWHQMRLGDVLAAGRELRRLHAESLQLRDALTAERDAYIAMPAWYEQRIKELEAQLTTQTNRAAAAEQQVTALTQRLDMANRLNTDARDQLPQLLADQDSKNLISKQDSGESVSDKAQLSARQAAPDGWRLVPESATLNMLDTAFGICTQNGQPVQRLIEAAAAKYAALLSAAPPPPEREPKCWCETCRPITISDMRMVLCPDCGNKRCPKATHHDNACTNSNAPGQPGSSWEHVKPHGAANDNP